MYKLVQKSIGKDIKKKKHTWARDAMSRAQFPSLQRPSPSPCRDVVVVVVVVVVVAVAVFAAFTVVVVVVAVEPEVEVVERSTLSVDLMSWQSRDLQIN